MKVTQTKDKIGNWIANIPDWGRIGFWNCSKSSARRAAEDKAEWEGETFTFRAAKDTPEDNALLAPGRAGCYDVGKRAEE